MLYFLFIIMQTGYPCLPEVKEPEILPRLGGVSGSAANPKLQMVTTTLPTMMERTNFLVPCGSTHSFVQDTDSNNSAVGEVWDLYAGDGVEEMMGLSLVIFEEEYLGPGVQLGTVFAKMSH